MYGARGDEHKTTDRSDQRAGTVACPPFATFSRRPPSPPLSLRRTRDRLCCWVRTFRLARSSQRRTHAREKKEADDEDENEAKGEDALEEGRPPFRDVLRAASEWYASRDFRAAVDAFARRHADAFRGAAADAQAEEQSLERTALHGKYLEVFARIKGKTVTV